MSRVQGRLVNFEVEVSRRAETGATILIGT